MTARAKEVVLESMERHLAHVKKRLLVYRIEARPTDEKQSVIDRMTAAARAWAAKMDEQEIETVEEMIRRQRGRIDADR